MGITCSYTMEASYGGTNMGSRAFTHFNTDDYEGIGRYATKVVLISEPALTWIFNLGPDHLESKILNILEKKKS